MSWWMQLRYDLRTFSIQCQSRNFCVFRLHWNLNRDILQTATGITGGSGDGIAIQM